MIGQLRALYRTCSVSGVLFAVAIVAMCGARFYGLEDAPRGFYYDEAAVANHALCISESGTDSTFGQRLPVFFVAESTGIDPGVYVYPAALWLSVFGASIGSFRALSALATTLTIVAVFLFTRELFGKRAALLAVVSASISPWAFQFSRIAWGNPFYPMFLIFGLYLLWTAKLPGRAMLAAILLVLAAYAYAPGRFVAPLLLVAVLAIRLIRRDLSWQVLVPFVLVAAATSWSLAHEMLNGPLNNRARQLSVFALYPSGGVAAVAQLFFHQLFEHFSPSFLLFKGDPHNLRHSTHHVGVLSWFDAIGGLIYLGALVATVWRRLKGESVATPLYLLIFIPCCFLVALMPSPLTTESVPHALRSIAAWPFVSIGVGFATAWIGERLPWAFNVLAMLSVAFVTKFLFVYFLLYPVESERWFDVSFKRQALQQDRAALLAAANAQRGRIPHPRFYAMTLGGIPCRELGITGPQRPPQFIPDLVAQLWATATALALGSIVGSWLRRRS